MPLAILQARMSSTRMPGKVMAPVLGEPMIWRQIERMINLLTADDQGRAFFRRGVSDYPAIGDAASLVNSDQLRLIYTPAYGYSTAAPSEVAQGGTAQ